MSGVLLALAHRQFLRGLRFKVKLPLLAAIALGTFFVAFQGYEWVQLIGEGLTLTSSTHGGFFYLIVGAHGMHALAALVALYFVYRGLSTGKLGSGLFGFSSELSKRASVWRIVPSGIGLGGSRT